VTHLDALLTGEDVSVTGDHWSARGVTVSPGLAQQRPPFWIAAGGPRGMRLAARLGQGWVANPVSDSPEAEVSAQVERLAETCETAGSDFSAMRRLLLTGFTDEPWLASASAYDDLAGRYTALGITDVALHWPRPGTEWDADLAVLEEIAARLDG
jgi:alkanesulfonate monooxygenase SsuD/methylene tetrahydromethanopterin reductase-like flavin-dependent oxidoreductase (luciferase family)